MSSKFTIEAPVSIQSVTVTLGKKFDLVDDQGILHKMKISIPIVEKLPEFCTWPIATINKGEQNLIRQYVRALFVLMPAIAESMFMTSLIICEREISTGKTWTLMSTHRIDWTGQDHYVAGMVAAYRILKFSRADHRRRNV